MGTRADFYVGTLIRLDDQRLAMGQAEWLGSKAFDGAPARRRWDAIPHSLLSQDEESTWRAAVHELLYQYQDQCTFPEQGWPWPWETSENTDWVYIFDPTTNRVHCVHFQTYYGTFQDWLACEQEYERWCEKAEEARTTLDEEAYNAWREAHLEPEWKEHGEVTSFPNMKKLQNIATGARSGIVVVTL